MAVSRSISLGTPWTPRSLKVPANSARRSDRQFGGASLGTCRSKSLAVRGKGWPKLVQTLLLPTNDQTVVFAHSSVRSLDEVPIPVLVKSLWSPGRLAAQSGLILSLGMFVIFLTIRSGWAASGPIGCPTPHDASWVLELQLGMAICTALLCGALACLSLARPVKSAACPHHVHGVRSWLSLGYFTALLKVASIECMWCNSDDHMKLCKYISASNKVGIACVNLGMLMLLRKRIMELEAAQGIRKWGRRMNRCVVWPTMTVVGTLLVLAFVMKALPSCSCQCEIRVWWMITVNTVNLGLSHVACTAMTVHAFRKALKLAEEDAATWAGALRDARMGTVARNQKQLRLLVLCCATSVVFLLCSLLELLKLYHKRRMETNVLKFYMLFSDPACAERSTGDLSDFFSAFSTKALLVVVDVAAVVDTITNGVCFLCLSGLVEAPSRSGWAAAGTGRRPQAALQRARSSRELGIAWDAKVQELSRRGVTLEKLLDFYATLGQAHMPHWNPKRHTTAHVVRQAIIPASKCSRFGPSALATVLHEGRPVQPKCMVTHCWDSLFSDLVCIVVADALGLPTYRGLAGWLLPDMIGTLRSHLRRVGTLDRAYWICALSVNQHSCICAGGAVALDPVLGSAEPRCDCRLAKCWNGTPPLSEQGQSCPCEINKFDDMMVLLAREDPDFTQLVAVDRQLLVFRRAWCMAETFVAHACTMRQVAVMLETQSLNALTLRVEDMEASREEDKRMILRKVGDPAAFNETLRKIVLGRNGSLLGAQWDAIGSARRLGHMARRH